MAPLAVYGIQDALGLWGTFGRPGTVHDFYVWIKGSWVFMEVAAIVVGAIALWRYPFPFIVMIIAFALWFMSMDLTPWIFGRAEFSWDERRIVSLWFGLAVLVAAFIVDRKPRDGDYGFWLHLFGLLAFWGGLSLSSSGSELGKLFYCLLNVGLLLLSVVLARRVYAVFGTLGIAGYLGHSRTRVQRFDAVPVCALVDRRGGDRGGIALSPPSGGHHGVGRGKVAGVDAAAAERTLTFPP